MNFSNYFFVTKTYFFLAFFLTIHSISSSGFPKFTDKKDILKTEDHVIVVKNNSVVFDLLQTESEFNNPVKIRVIEHPKFGDVTLNNDQSFEYALSLIHI